MFTSCGTTSHIEAAQDINFSEYKTFGWLNDSSVKAATRVAPSSGHIGLIVKIAGKKFDVVKTLCL